jgi:hypothetical protein
LDSISRSFKLSKFLLPFVNHFDEYQGKVAANIAAATSQIIHSKLPAIRRIRSSLPFSDRYELVNVEAPPNSMDKSHLSSCLAAALHVDILQRLSREQLPVGFKLRRLLHCLIMHLRWDWGELIANNRQQTAAWFIQTGPVSLSP